MHRLVLNISILTILSLSLLSFSCSEKKQIPDSNNLTGVEPGIIPRMKLYRDTIKFGDTLTGLIGCVFRPTITEIQKEQIIKSLSYRIDANHIDLTAETEFFKTSRINDSTFRFAFLPQSDISLMPEMRSFYASVKVEFYAPDQRIQDYTFQERFVYYVRE